MRIIECCNARWDSRKLSACPRCGKSLKTLKTTPPAPVAVEECKCLARLESDSGSPTCGLCDKPFKVAHPAECPTMNCPHCGSGLLWSEDRGPHCDGCDDFDPEMGLTAQPADRPTPTYESLKASEQHLFRKTVDLERKLADQRRLLEILSGAVQQVLQFKPNGLNECAYECAVWDDLQTAYNETKPQ